MSYEAAAQSSSAATPVRVLSAGNEGSYIQTSPDIPHPVTTDETAINIILGNLPDVHAASNSNLLFYSLNGDILSSSGNLADVQSTIKNYTDSFSGPTDAYTPVTPSALFLSDLKAIGDAAASGDKDAATSALQQAKNDSWTNTAQASTGLDGELRNTAYIRDGLVMEGYSLSDATAQADAITIGGLAQTTGDAKADTARSNEISDLARVLTLEAGSSDKKVAQAASETFSDAVNQLLGATSNGAANKRLAALDVAYGTPSATQPTSSLSTTV